MRSFSKLKFSQLYDYTQSGNLTETLWATELANNIKSYFLDGTAPPNSLGDYLYTHIPPLTVPDLDFTTFKNDLISLYIDRTKDFNLWGQELGTIITDFWSKFEFEGKKTMLQQPYTVSDWNGNVSSDLSKVSLIAQLTPLYQYNVAPNPYDSISDWVTAIENAINLNSMICYLEFPTIVLL